MLEKVKHYFILAVGVFIVSFSVNTFLAPHNIAAGGVSGIGILLNHSFNIPVSTTVMVLNLILLVFAFVFLGKEIFIKTAYGSILLPIFLGIIPQTMLVSDTLLSMAVGSIIFGVGVSILYRNNGSSGGTTIPPMILYKYFKIDKSLGLLFVDSIIVLFSLIIFGVEPFILAIVSLLITSATMNYISTGTNRKLQLMIVSEKHQDELLKAIYSKMSRGVTVIPAVGGYSNQRRDILMVAINQNEYNIILEIIDEIDPKSFVVIQSIKDIHGQGFTYNSVV